MSARGEGSERAVVVHRVRAREPWAMVTAAIVAAPIIGGTVLALIDPLYAMMMFGMMFGWTGAIVLWPLLAAHRRATRIDADPKPRLSRASSAGLFVDGGPALPRERIVAAFVSPSWPNGAYLRLHRRGAWPVELWTADVEGAHALVAALGLDEQHVVGIARGAPRLSSVAARLVIGVLLAALSLLIVARVPLLSPLPLLFAAAFAAFTVLPVEHVVGTDGVLTRWLGRRVAFVPIDQIAEVNPEPGRVRLVLKNGETRHLVVAGRIGGAAATIGMQVGLLAERVRRAMRRAGTLEIDASSLERSGRELGAWIASLRDLTRGTGYRAAVQREDLVYLVEDPRRPPQVRVAAAIALGDGDPHERARLRIAADSSSIPEVREAIEAALESDEARISDALARLPDQHPAR